MKIIGTDDANDKRTTNYLHQLRANSAYTTFRVVVNIIQWLFFLAGGAVILGSVYAKDAGTFMGIVMGVVLIVVGKVGKQSIVMLADIADATIDIASQRSKDNQQEE